MLGISNDGGQVRTGACVAMLTGQTGLQRAQVQFVISNSVSRMTVEAGLGFLIRHGPTNSFGERLGIELFIAGRDAETIDERVIADAAFVKLAIALQHPGLCLRAHRPQDRDGDRLPAVAEGVLALTVFGLDRVAVGTNVEGELRVRGEHIIRAGRLQSVRHLTVMLQAGLRLVATGTGDVVCLLLALRKSSEADKQERAGQELSEWH